MMLDQLAKYEVENFEQEHADSNWYKGKQQKEVEAMEKARKRGKLSKSFQSLACPVTHSSHHQRSEKDA